MDASTQWESFKVKGTQLIELFKNLVHEGNVRRIVIKHDTHTVAEFPMTMGVVGVALAPAVAAVGAIAALLSECTIEVERTTKPDDPASGGKPA